MPIEHETRDGHLVWIRNPITGAISYVVDVRGKSFAFTLSGHQTHAAEPSALSADAVRRAVAECPFCPGNEALTTRELMRVGVQSTAASSRSWITSANPMPTAFP